MQPALFSLVIAISLAAAQAGSTAQPSLKERITEVSKKCATDTKVTPEQARIAFTQDIPKTENERCFLECVYKGAGVVKDNKFSVEGSKKLAVARFPDPKQKAAADHLIDTCSKEIITSGEKCALGKNVRACFVKHGKEVNFFPSA